MNTRVVKSFGLALLVAVGVLALMLALGTFNAPKAGAAASDVELRLSDRNLDTHVEVTVSYSETEAETGDNAIAITFANLVLGSSSAFNGNVKVTGPISETDTFTYTVADNDATVAGQVLTLTLAADLDADTTDTEVFIAGDYTVVIAAGSEDDGAVIETSPRTEVSGDDPAVTEFMATAMVGGVTSNEVRIFEYDADALSSRNAGAGVSVTLEFTTTADIDAGDDVVIEMKSFQIPATIDADAVSLKDGTNTANAADVSVSGSKITVEVPDMNGDGTGTPSLVAGDVTIRLRSRAGVMNPNLAGENYQITVMHEQELYKQNPGPINATLEVAPGGGVEGAKLTVSGVGYSKGTATIYIVAGDDVPAAGSADTTPDDFKSVGSATVSDGSFSTSVTVGDKFEAGANNLIARSSTGKWGAQDGFNLNGAISLPDSVTKGTDLTVKVSKWSAGIITRATINGEDMVSIDADGAAEADFTPQIIKGDKTAEFKIRVGSKALLGEQTLILYTIDPEDDSERSSGTKNIDIVGIELAVSPSVAVVGQEVTVTGTGFRTRDGDDPAEIDTLTVGGVSVLEDVTDRAIASGGRVVAAFRVPDNVDLADAGEYTIALSDGERSGSAKLTIPERTLTISPLEGRIGTAIELSGTGWPSGTGANLVGIYYDGTQLSTATSNSSGEWSATITVPDNASVGMTHKVAAKASVGTGTDNVTKDADHKTPDAVVTPSPAQAQRGDTITVSGENFHTFRPVMIEIGESNVTPSPAPTTDGTGSFSRRGFGARAELGQQEPQGHRKRHYSG